MATLSGGEKFEAAIREIASNLESGATLNVGFLEGALYPDGKPVAMIAAINESGAPSRNIPPRPFFRTMIAKKSGEWPDAISGLLKRTDYNVDETLRVTGEAIQGQLIDSIENGGWIPNKPSTLARKHGEQPLIDTGTMINSVRYEIVK